MMLSVILFYINCYLPFILINSSILNKSYFVLKSIVIYEVKIFIKPSYNILTIFNLPLKIVLC